MREVQISENISIYLIEDHIVNIVHSTCKRDPRRDYPYSGNSIGRNLICDYCKYELTPEEKFSVKLLNFNDDFFAYRDIIISIRKAWEKMESWPGWK
jgi:hypothetical protein